MWTLHATDTESTVPCEVSRMALDEIAAARFSWGREFQRRRQCGAHDPDSLIWAGGFLSGASPEYDFYLSGYVIKAAGDIQGLVVIDPELRTSRSQPAAAVAYVRYLATAPWNRNRQESRGLYRGIGRLLVTHTITTGISLGSQGRVGLHSLVAACPFYDRLGFKNFGVDPAERGMTYFELLPDAAQSLLATAGNSC